MEALHIHRLRLLIHMLQVQDPTMIDALFANLQIATHAAWLTAAP